jgi:hypothetical protein
VIELLIIFSILSSKKSDRCMIIIIEQGR